MNTEKISKDNAGKAMPDSAVSNKSGVKAVPILPPLFRRVDWLTFGIAALLVFIGYFLTVAPDVTLEDSGELATGSFYAGVPHPPGYPLWSVVTYIFTKLFPVGNIAYRVAVASALSGALAAGLLGLLVSRGSSMIIEGIAEFKDLPRKLENAICVVSGVSGGLMMAYNGYMWSQSVIVEVYPLSVLSLMGVMCLVLRWMYAPHQMRYIYWAWFLFGICFTNHQTLIVAAMGLEVAIIAAQPKLGRDMLLWNAIVYILGLFILMSHALGQFEPSQMVIYLFHIVGISSIIGCIWLAFITKSLGKLSVPVLIMFGLWIVGAAFYFYMPITSMTNPPMNWGYARTWDGFLHALSRGQYEKTNPTNFFSDPMRLVMQLGLYLEWAKDEFNLVNLTLAAVPIAFFFRLQKRERAWLIGLAGIWFCLAIVLLILLNPAPDRASQGLNKVFFASSYTVIAMYIGYGLTLIAASLATQYQRFRLWAICGGVVAATLALKTLYDTTQTFGGGRPFFETISRSFAPNQYGLPVQGGLILLGLACLFLLINLVFRAKAQMTVALAIFALLPVHSIMDHWADNEERNHWFGYWFGHDMFTPPFGIYPEMTKDAVLFGGTDPGRFCPTYMIFCESFIPHDKQPKEDPETGLLPGTDTGFIPKHKLAKEEKYDRRDVYIITQNALADPTYLEYIRAQYNRSTQIDPPFFQEMLRSKREVEQSYTTNGLARLAYQALDRPFTSFGAKVEASRRAEGVYPPKEIYTPTPEDSSRCFSEYMADAQQRLDHDLRFPSEPKQIKPMEEVHITPGDEKRVSISGQVAVMSINGLLTKVIFDHNPTNEFFVEESFPLDWMYPYLSPAGVIMKINRQPMDELTEDAIKKDHEFWSRYSDRLIGNWVTYDTSVKDIATFVEKVYLEHDYNGFKGDRKFIRDDQGQKAFSKLRSSIGGVYDWRFRHAKNPADQQRMFKEADFAYRQAFAYCPYSPEAVFRYVTLLIATGRVDDALLVAQTCAKLDPNNGQVINLVKQLEGIKTQGATANPPQPNLQQLEKEMTDNPTNFQAAFNVAGAYLQIQQPDRAVQALDHVLTNEHADANAMIFLAKAYAQLSNFPKLEIALEKLTQLEPHSPEAWCDLAAMKAAIGKHPEAVKDLRRSLEENTKRLAANPKANNLLTVIRADPRFNALHALPEYQQLVPAK